MPIRDDLRTAVTSAMKARDRVALAVYRSALAAIDNAEAVPADGRTEAPRRRLSEDDMVDLVAGEATERRAAADLVADPSAAHGLRAAADLLDALVAGRAGEG